MKTSWARWTAAAVLLAGLGTFSPAAAGDEKTSDNVFVGYLYGRPRNINFSLYTHLCHAFLLADAEGRIQPSRGVPDRALTADAHKAGVKVLLSLGGWGYDAQFAATVAKPESEERYVRAVLKIVDESDYDGIDLDWEYPDTKAEAAGFERLVRRFRKDLDAIGKRKGRPALLTMAASSNRGTLDWLGKDVLLETMDWINVMTYDFAGDWTDYAGHHAPLFTSPRQPKGRTGCAAATIAYLLDVKGLPANRVALGIPLYGRGFAVREPYLSTKGAPKTRMPEADYANLHKLLREQGWARSWDDATKTPWLIAPDHTAVIGYDDAESVAIKTEWAMKQGLRGVFFWQIGGDRLADGSNPVQEAAYRVWKTHALAAKGTR